MHRSRLAGFIIDCHGADPEVASRFWGEALGMAPQGLDGESYVPLDGSARDLHIEVQRVEHESRLHLDIETDNVDAEAARLEALGARRIEKRNTWWILEAPTGQRFCVVRARGDLSGKPGVTTWGAPGAT